MQAQAAKKNCTQIVLALLPLKRLQVALDSFFSASGYRNNSNGSFYNVGRNGNYWSASVYNATNGFNLNFNVSNVNPQNNNNRSNGFPVRCVSQP